MQQNHATDFVSSCGFVSKFTFAVLIFPSSEHIGNLTSDCSDTSSTPFLLSSSCKMGSRWSTPISSSAAPGGTQQAISPAIVPILSRGKNHVPAARHSAGVSPSSTSATRAVVLSRARLKRRHRLRREKGVDNVSRVVTVHGLDAAADKTAAGEVARQIVGERILLYWPRISAWYAVSFSCDVAPMFSCIASLTGRVALMFFDTFLSSAGSTARF